MNTLVTYAIMSVKVKSKCFHLHICICNEIQLIVYF